jgi:FOG: GGDEF domain
VSIGIALFPQHGASIASLAEAADRALYAAKHAGRGTYSLAV